MAYGASMKTPDAAALAVWIRLVAAVSMAVAIGGCWLSNQPVSGVPPPAEAQTLPAKEFSNPARTPHDPAALYFTFDQLDHYYRVPGEFTHRLTGDQYGFETMSFIITETHPGGGPGLHVHDVEEAHVLLEGRAEYRVGDSTFFVDGPYVAKVPAGVPHTFINAGPAPFNLIAVFASKHPGTKRLGPNPLIQGIASVDDAPLAPVLGVSPSSLRR